MIHWASDGIEYAADQRHVEIIVVDLGLVTGGGATTPGVAGTKEDIKAEEEELAGA